MPVTPEGSRNGKVRTWLGVKVMILPSLVVVPESRVAADRPDLRPIADVDGVANED